MKLFVSLFLLLFSSLSFAEQVSSVGGSLVKPGDYLGQIVISLFLIILIIFISAWLLKRYNKLTGVTNGSLQVLGMLAVGQREKILLVQVGKKQLLLGATTSKITTLHELEEPIELEDKSSNLTVSFYERLQDAIKQRSTSEKS